MHYETTFYEMSVQYNVVFKYNLTWILYQAKSFYTKTNIVNYIRTTQYKRVASWTEGFWMDLQQPTISVLKLEHLQTVPLKKML